MRNTDEMLAGGKLFSDASKSIQFRIITLVVLVLVPLIGVFAWLAVNFADARRNMIEMQRFDAVNGLNAAVDREMAGVLGILSGLAGSDDLVDGRLADFERHAAALATRPHINRIWAFSGNGEVVAAAGVPANQSAAAIEQAEIDRVFRGASVVTNIRGEGLAAATTTVAVPVTAGGKVVRGVAAEVSLSHLSDVFAVTELGRQWVAAIVDSDGRFVARSLDAQRRVGKLARPELGFAARGAPTSGVFDNVTFEGVAMRNSFGRSSLTGWTTVVAVPTSELTSPLRQTIVLVTIGGIAALGLAIAFAMLMAERISEPVRNLSDVATALVEGRSFREPRFHIAELDEVRKSIERAIERNAHHAALVASSGDAIMSINLDGKVLSWNQAAERLFGYTAAEMIGQLKIQLVPDDLRQEFQEQREQVLAGHSVRAETVRRRRDGRLVDVSIDVAPIRRPDGTIIAISSILHDITERKASEQHLMFLMRELAHRSKNQLAIIQSIATQTGRGVRSVDDFLMRFRRRLQSLSVSHDLLVAENWTSVPLSTVIGQQMRIFAADNPNVTTSGPNIRVSANAAGAIGLALHELATNSVKYGALSVAAGKVEVAWRLDGSDAEHASLELTWQESGGPPATTPASKGFGSLVIERMAPQAVDGTAEVSYQPDGLRWRLKCPAKDNVRFPIFIPDDEGEAGERPARQQAGGPHAGEDAAMP